MKKQLFILSSFCLILILLSCGSDTCEQSDWVGQWLVEGENICESGSSSISAPEGFELKAGSSIDFITIEGEEVKINMDNCSFIFDNVTLMLNGNEITTNFNSTCTFTYKRI